MKVRRNRSVKMWAVNKERNVYANVTTYHGEVYVHLRAYMRVQYECGSRLVPTRKGIALTPADWNVSKNYVPTIDASVKEVAATNAFGAAHRSDLGSNQHGRGCPHRKNGAGGRTADGRLLDYLRYFERVCCKKDMLRVCERQTESDGTSCLRVDEPSATCRYLTVLRACGGMWMRLKYTAFGLINENENLLK